MDFGEPYERLQAQGIHLVVNKVKAHCDDNSIVPKEQQAGNNMADHYAGRAVIEVTTGDESRVRRLDRKTRLMQERMIQANFLLPKRQDILRMSRTSLPPPIVGLRGCCRPMRCSTK